jgi:hypothetical protein
MLDFPNSPTLGTTYLGPNGVVWSWDGAKWINGTVGTSTAYAPLNSPNFIGNPTAPNPVVGDNDTSLSTTSFVQAATGTALNNVGRNLVMNPLFNIAQRGNGPFTANGYTLDRWTLFLSTDTASVTRQQLADADRTQIGDEAANYSCANAFTGTAGAAARTQFLHPIEDVRRLAGKTVTVSFYAQAPAPRSLGVSIDQIFGTGGSPSAAVLNNGQSVAVTTTWARYTLTFTLASLAGKTLGTAGDHSTTLNLWYSSGTTNAARAGNVGVQSGTIQLWGVQLEVSSIMTPLEKPDPQQDLAKAQRFFATGTVIGVTYHQAGYNYAVPFSLPVMMRAIPTAVITNTASSSNLTGATLTMWTPRDGYAQGAAVATTSTILNFSYTVSADL